MIIYLKDKSTFGIKKFLLLNSKKNLIITSCKLNFPISLIPLKYELLILKKVKNFNLKNLKEICNKFDILILYKIKKFYQICVFKICEEKNKVLVFGKKGKNVCCDGKRFFVDGVFIDDLEKLFYL